MSRAFLKPRSVDIPPQGDYKYTPVVRVFEADSAANLQAAMDGTFAIDSLSVAEFWVIEDIEYQVVYKVAPMSEWRYSALVWATKAEKV